MAQADSAPMISQWLKEKGYSGEEIQKILAKLAERDHQTLSDAFFDSIGGNQMTLEQFIKDVLRD